MKTITRHRTDRRGRGHAPRRAGLTIVELVIASGIIAILLLASAAAMGENVESAKSSASYVDGGVFLESVQEDISSMTPAELLAMDGQTLFSHDDWQNAPFRINVVVFRQSATLLQVELELVDQSKSLSLATLHTFKAIA